MELVPLRRMVKVLCIVDPSIPLCNAARPISEGGQHSIISQIPHWIDEWPIDPSPNQFSSLRTGIFFGPASSNDGTVAAD